MLLKVSESSRRLIGFFNTSEAPSVMVPFSSPKVVWPVITIMGRSGWLRRSRRINSWPPIPGMSQSVMTMSAARDWWSFSASQPFPAVATS